MEIKGGRWWGKSPSSTEMSQGKGLGTQQRVCHFKAQRKPQKLRHRERTLLQANMAEGRRLKGTRFSILAKMPAVAVSRNKGECP